MPHSDEFAGHRHEGQKVARHSHHPPAVTEWNKLAANGHAGADGSIPSLQGGDFSGLRAVYVW